MRICLLTTQDLDAGSFPEDDWPCDPRPFLPEATWQVEVLEKSTSVERVTALAENGFDLFFNLCDGAADEDTPGIEVVKTLEKLGQAFTGATAEFYEPSRLAMKRTARLLQAGPEPRLDTAYATRHSPRPARRHVDLRPNIGSSIGVRRVWQPRLRWMRRRQTATRG